MPIPAGNVSTVNLDATTDSPATARADLLALTQQFNSLIASANGVTGMAVLDASGFLAGYGRLVAAQTWTGVNTFTSGGGLKVWFSNAFIEWADTASALPAGRYLWQSSGGTFRLVKNTAVLGDYSTGTFPITINANNSVTFLDTVSVANGVAADNAVNKGQLDAKVLGGLVFNSGTTPTISGPSGWTLTDVGVGLIQVNHNLGATNYTVVVSPSSTGAWTANPNALNINDFRVQTIFGGANADVNFNFVVVRI